MNGRRGASNTFLMVSLSGGTSGCDHRMSEYLLKNWLYNEGINLVERKNLIHDKKIKTFLEKLLRSINFTDILIDVAESERKRIF